MQDMAGGGKGKGGGQGKDGAKGKDGGKAKGKGKDKDKKTGARQDAWNKKDGGRSQDNGWTRNASDKKSMPCFKWMAGNPKSAADCPFSHAQSMVNKIAKAFTAGQIHALNLAERDGPSAAPAPATARCRRQLPDPLTSFRCATSGLQALRVTLQPGTRVILMPCSRRLLLRVVILLRGPFGSADAAPLGPWERSTQRSLLYLRKMAGQPATLRR